MYACGCRKEKLLVDRSEGLEVEEGERVRRYAPSSTRKGLCETGFDVAQTQVHISSCIYTRAEADHGHMQGLGNERA
jgi:hypothetical protein